MQTNHSGPTKIWFLNRLDHALSEGSMGFFGLLALTFAMIPFFFRLSPRAEDTLYLGQWMVVGIFFVDYTVHFITAKSKRKYVKRGVRILSAVIIITAIVSLLESVPDEWVASPALQLLNVIAGLAIGARAGAVIVEHFEPEAATPQFLPCQVFVSHPDRMEGFRESTWLELIEWTSKPSDSWYHAESVSTGNLGQLSGATGIPEAVLKSCIGQENYPRIFFFGHSVLISFWLRLSAEEAGADPSDVPLVLILNRKGLITLCPGSVHLHHRIQGEFASEVASKLPFNLRAMYALFDFVLKGKQERIDAQEQILRRLESHPSIAFRSETLQEAYELKSLANALRADLWRLKELFERLESGKIHFPDMEPMHHAAFDYLADTADFLFHTAEQLRESVVSLIDLYINRSTYEMTKFMRLLAVISVLGLVPAAISGLLGMNIAGAPWPWSLSQVGFLVSVICVFCVYYFVVKGWLK